MKAIKFFIAMWQILFATLAVYSQTTITGHVYIDKEPVFAATVFLANHHQVNTITNENGFFSMNVPDSIQKDTLIVCYLGYKDYKAPLTDWKEPHMIHLELNFSITTLSEIVIQTDLTASKEFAASQLDRTAIYMTPAAGADPLRAVTLQPYSTNTEESANPQLRGSLGNYSRVFINNVPIKNPVRVCSAQTYQVRNLFIPAIHPWNMAILLAVLWLCTLLKVYQTNMKPIFPCLWPI